MVEMVETAAILNQAGERALVILDEIGRGTATYDGLSIAWAVVEHLHEVNRCRALFATHYHELTSLADRLAALRCATMRIREWEKEIIFLHEVVGRRRRPFLWHPCRANGGLAAGGDGARRTSAGMSSKVRRIKIMVAPLPSDFRLLTVTQTPGRSPQNHECRFGSASLRTDPGRVIAERGPRHDL